MKNNVQKIASNNGKKLLKILKAEEIFDEIK